MQENGQLLLRAAAAVVAVVALALWDVDRYGVPFWLWLAALIAIWISLPGATGTRMQRPAAGVLGALGGILALAWWLRFPDIVDMPANVSIDEMMPALEAMSIAAGERPNVFSSVGWFTIPNLSFAVPAIVMAALPGDDFFALRFSSLLTGLLGITGTFFLARRLFGDGVALTAAFLMAAGFWHIHNSRTGFPFVQTSCAVPWVLYLLVRARQEGSRTGLFAAGVGLGFALQLYFPVRALLMLVPLFLGVGWWMRGDGWRRRLSDAALVALGAALALGPLLLSVPIDRLAGRSQNVLITQPGPFAERARIYQTTDRIEVVRRNIEESLGMFTEWADVCVLNRSSGGLFDRWTLGAMVLGTAIAIVRLHPQALLLVAWSAVVFLLGVALTDAPRASYRLGPAMPAFYMLAAFGLHAAMVSPSGRPGVYRRFALAVLALLAGYQVVDANRRHFTEYAQKGHGRIMAPAAMLRFGRERCDGRAIYLIPYPEPFGTDQTGRIFCKHYQTIRLEEIPERPDKTRAATFIVPSWQRDALSHIRECYPGSHIEDRRAPDGRFLFTIVDVEQGVVSRGPLRCEAPEPEVESDFDASVAEPAEAPAVTQRSRAAPAPASRRPQGAAPATP